jgi:glutathione peroxidase
MRVSLLLVLALLAAPLSAQAACQQPILDKTERRLIGGEENLCQTYGGQVVLVVNTASKCGFTPQYEGLEALYQARKPQGFVVLGFPSDQFLGQEFDDEQEIATFCKVNYGVSFPLFRKSDVKGKDANPLFKDLTEATGKQPAWNFNKYLIGRDGRVIAHFGSRVKPDAAELTRAVDAALAEPVP